MAASTEELRLRFVADDLVSQVAQKVGDSLLGMKAKAVDAGGGLEAMQAKSKLASLEADALGMKAQLAGTAAAELQAKAAAAGDGTGVLATKAKLASNEAETLGIRAQMASANAASLGKEAEAAASKTSLLSTAGGVAAAGLLGVAAAGVAVVGSLAATVPSAVHFQQQMTLIRTQAHDTQDNLQQMGAAVLALAPKVGAGPDQLAEGLYHVTSVGYRGAEALSILEQAAKGAAISGANLDDTTYSLTSVMNTFGLKGAQAGQTMAALNAIVGAGDMRFQDLNAAIGSGFLAAGETFGVSLQSMGAALAYLTDRGASAEESATRLKMSIALLGAPTKQSAGILKDLGLTEDETKQRTSAMEQALAKSGVTTTQLSADLRKPDGIQVALRDLVDHMRKAGLSADETAAVLSRAFGGGRSGAAIMSMVQHLDTLQSKFDTINQGQARFQSDWQDTVNTVNFQWQRFTSTLEADAIKIGSKLLPAANTILTALNNLFGQASSMVGPWTDRVAGLLGQGGVEVARFVNGIGIGVQAATPTPLPTLSRSYSENVMESHATIIRTSQAAAMAQQAGAKAMTSEGGLGAVGTAIGQFISGPLHNLENATRTVLGAIAAWWKAHGQQVMGYVFQIRDELTRDFHQVMGAIMGIVGPALQGLQKWWKDHGDQVMRQVQGFWNLVVTIFQIAMPMVIAVVQDGWTLLKDVIQTVFDIIVGVVKVTWDVISGTFTVFLDLISGNWGQAWNDMKGSFGQIWKDISSMAGNVIGDLARIIGDGLHGIVNIFNGFIAGIDTVLDKFGLHIPPIFSDRGGSNVSLRLGSGGQGGMASGGVFDQPTAIVAEGGYPEVVVPLDPKYRSRALGLLAYAGAHMMAGGGILGGLFDAAGNAALGAAGRLGGTFGTLASGLLRQVIGALPDWLGSQFSRMGGAAGGGVSGDVNAWLLAAIAATGVPANWLPGLQIIAKFESGGNPQAINLSDSNAAAGDPSRGLMQTIGATFEAYRLRSLPDDIYNPVANAAAAIEYILSRYGDVWHVPGVSSVMSGGGYVGYDRGGLLMPGLTLAYNGTGRPEVVTPPGAGGAQEIHTHLHIGEQELATVVTTIVDRRLSRAFA